jgi:hypothetical protein
VSAASSGRIYATALSPDVSGRKQQHQTCRHQTTVLNSAHVSDHIRTHLNNPFSAIVETGKRIPIIFDAVRLPQNKKGGAKERLPQTSARLHPARKEKPVLELELHAEAKR